MEAFGNGTWPAYLAPVRPARGLNAPAPAARFGGICCEIGWDGCAVPIPVGADAATDG